jgi:hypothetical protein
MEVVRAVSDSTFRDEVERTIVLYEETISHFASRTRKMIAQHGEIEALSLLMVSPDLQKGFKALRDTGQLDKTFESIVVRFQHLFTPEVVQAAQWRLSHPYDLL